MSLVVRNETNILESPISFSLRMRMREALRIVFAFIFANMATLDLTKRANQ